MADASSPSPQFAAQPTPAAPVYDPVGTYDVTLSRAVEYPQGSGFFFSPRDHHLFSGSMCSDVAGAIVDAKPV